MTYISYDSYNTVTCNVGYLYDCSRMHMEFDK